MKSVYLSFQILVFLLLFLGNSLHAEVAKNVRYNSAQYRFENNILTVSTGKVERQWQVTPFGLKTISVKNSKSKKVWKSANSTLGADWSYEGLISDTSTCQLISISTSIDDDQGFTNKYLNIEAEFSYQATNTFIKYQIWAFPNAPGIRTQVWIKGKATPEMLNNVPHIDKNDLRFKLNKGTIKNNYAASEVSKLWFSKTVEANNNIEYQLFGLKKNKAYKLGFSWWDFEGIGRTQQIKLASVDGETQVVLVNPTQLPDYKNMKALPVEMEFDLPDNVMLDGSLRIIVESTNGTPVTISEMWVYEKSGNIRNDAQLLDGDKQRINQLKKSANEFYSLVAYNDCGTEQSDDKKAVYGRCDFVPASLKEARRLYSGYYNDTQHRNSDDTPLLKEDDRTEIVSAKEVVDWASIVMIADKTDGLAMIKESHKCVNQSGVETGDFVVTANGIENRGTSLYPKDLSPTEYKWFWASWLVLWSGNDDAGRLAIKQFDRIRYTVNPELDIYLMANTWGSSHGKDAAKEVNVLKEIKSQAKLGIDIQQIDDGWQDRNWKPSKEFYPSGWENVVESAKTNKVKLGLWGAAMPITLDALKYNYDNGKFVTYKLDFANLSTHDLIDSVIGKIRSFVLYTDHKVRVNWDVTENAPRYGYFWAREYGSVFLENRKPDVPTNAVYVPHLVLRDLWHLAKYANLNKFQGSVQNKEMVDRKLSDAWQHTHSYCTAIPLMSTPLFFQETQFLSNSAVNEIKPVLLAYKKVRSEIYNCYIYPIGEEPDNASWSGFQAYNPSLKVGYLTVFREIDNKEQQKKLQLKFIANKKLKFTNLMNGKIEMKRSDKNGFVEFDISQNGDFRFYKIEAK